MFVNAILLRRKRRRKSAAIFLCGFDVYVARNMCLLVLIRVCGTKNEIHIPPHHTHLQVWPEGGNKLTNSFFIFWSRHDLHLFMWDELRSGLLSCRELDLEKVNKTRILTLGCNHTVTKCFEFFSCICICLLL